MLKILLSCLGIGTVFIVLVSSISASEIQPRSIDSRGKHFKERQRFESLLAAGRTLAFPYGTGLILSAISSQSKNWPISLEGMSEILDLSPDELLTTYTDSANLLKQDDHVTSCGNLYLLQNWKGNLSSTSAQTLDKLQIGVKRVKWEKETFNDTWELMNTELNVKTHNLLDGKLIPKDSEVGNPFRFSTQTIAVSTFHYNNNWKKTWGTGDLTQFGSENAKNVPFLEQEGEFLFSDAEDYSAISVPLEGERKSVVFILPKINLTQYLKQSSARNKKKVWAERVKVRQAGEADELENGGESDFVPFPRRWEKRHLSIHIPSFSLTAADQYGKELGELGMNETFCTTLRDRRGVIPYYLRPIVQLNTVTVSDIKVEIASATGTALEKFYFGTDLAGVGYPRLRSRSFKTSPEKTEIQRRKSDEIIAKSKLQQNTGDETTTSIPFSGEFFGEEAENSTTISPANDADSRDKFVFNKPFLWYLEDSKLGPLVYGIVEKVAEDEEYMTTPEESSKFSDEMQRYLLWSCRSFKQSGEIDESGGQI